MFPFNTTPIQPSLFDIRIRSFSRNIVVIQGQTHEANSLVLSGHIVFAIPELVTLRSVSLNLVGVFRLDFLESFQGPDGEVIAACPIRKETVVVRSEWKNLLTDPVGEVIQTGVGEYHGISSSSSPSPLPIQLLAGLRTKPLKLRFSESIPSGETPFPEYRKYKDALQFDLPRGNYSLPFEVALPGNIPETVEGLRCGVILYRLQSHLDSIRLSSRRDPQCCKYLRIFRKPLITEAILNEDCSVENTWPGKVQYEVRLARKAIPIGGKIKVHILMVPLSKGLKLGEIKATIQQYFALKGSDEESFEDRKNIFEYTFPAISMDQLSPDKWSLEAKICVPENLKQCTPDVELKDDIIRVRHRLVLDINILNPDGHSSQVRSKLPVIFYISGREPVLGRNVYVDHSGRVRFKSGTTRLFVPKEPKDTALDTTDSTDTGSSTPDLPVIPMIVPSPREFGLRRNSLHASPLHRPHEHHHHVHPQEIRVDPDYDFGAELEPDSMEDTEANTADFLPSYKDSEKDIYLDPEMVSPLESPMASPIPIPEESLGSYFDANPITLERGYHSQSNSPQFQYISRVNSVNTPQFDERINEVPSYNSVYDDDFVISSDPAPLYERAMSEASGAS
ncbi:DEKNAAC104167 [Brettanomyces naardenensis]|uniref:DEKNAAC104167 n=1 Tax=Brettanomyces naardenensis TaxID=13370 RepID=A0A448YQ75_BRENA|nr:DEKNAAC104167 [Brettanomyces naardenensis]